MKYTTNMSLGIKIMRKLYEVQCTRYQEPGTKYQVQCAQPAECRQVARAKTQEARHKSQETRAELPSFASWRLCANKKEKIRRGGPFWKRISYHNELSLISCLLSL